jgi:hypothetical protein
MKSEKFTSGSTIKSENTQKRSSTKNKLEQTLKAKQAKLDKIARNNDEKLFAAV